MSSVSTSSVASAKIEEREKLFINIGVMEEGQMTMTPRMLIFSGGDTEMNMVRQILNLDYKNAFEMMQLVIFYHPDSRIWHFRPS